MLLSFFFVALLSLTSAEIAPRGIFDQYLNVFNTSCLSNLWNDQAARDALRKLTDLNLSNQHPNEVALLNVETLELSDHLECSTQTSTHCEEVMVFPPRQQAPEIAANIRAEFEAKTDDQILSAFRYDVISLCSVITEIEDALQPHNGCISYNLNALANLPSSVRSAVLALLKASSPGGSGNAFNYDLSEALELSKGCGEVQKQIASSFRSQLTTEFWRGIVEDALRKYDIEAFDKRIQTDKNTNFKAQYNCTIPLEMICFRHQAIFYSTCKLNEEQDFNFELQKPLDNNTETGSLYYDSFFSFSEAIAGAYPCYDTFKDQCFGRYLKRNPEVLDLNLDTNCRISEYYYGLTGEPAPPSEEDDNEGNKGGEDNDENDGNNDENEDNSGDDDDQDVIPTPTGSKDKSSKGSISSGSIAAIVLGTVALIGIIAAGAFFFLKKRNDPNQYQVRLE